MSQMTALIGVLRTHDGDELILEADRQPQFLKAGEPLRLFLRTIPPDRHQHIVAELLTEAERKRLSDRGKVQTRYADAEHGTFVAHVRGRGGERIRFVRQPDDDEPTATHAPVPAAVLAATEAAVQQARAPEPAPVAAVAPPVSEVRGKPPAALVQLLTLARERRASDVHVATGEGVVLRIDGRLQPVGGRTPGPEALLTGLLSAADEAALVRGEALDLAVSLTDGGRFRLHVYPHEGGRALAARVLRPRPPTLASLHLPVSLDWVTQLPHGLVLFCGATGSGKSTTMAALVQQLLAERGGLLVTLEDPIEYVFRAPKGSLVRQRQVGRHVPSFADGLRDALREDPDVLLVGEMRDPQSIQLALTAAETGHLVLASLHSRSAPAAVERIVDAYPPERQQQIRVQLADALRGVVAQQLLPGVRGGRRPALEVLRINQAAAASIRDGKTPQLVSILQTGRNEGMIPMDRCVQQLVDKGLVRDD
jgi:twitching motility protein PilT